MAADTQGQPLLQTFQKHIEDMRNLVMCKICIKALYEPFILSCGHTYCYSCLTSWFTGGNGERRRKQNMKCPDCRAAVVLEPSPNYALRDLVHMFISRTELLPEDETTHEHEMAKIEEAVQLTSDRSGVGLFKGAFRNVGPRRLYFGGTRTNGAMHDPHDNVDRCPICHWELEEPDHCIQCEWSVSDIDFSDNSSQDDSSIGDVGERFDEETFQNPRRRRRLHEMIDPMGSPTPSLLNALSYGRGEEFEDYDSIGSPSIVTISSDVDDLDPVDQDFGGDEDDAHSDAESDLPVVMGGRRYNVHFNPRRQIIPTRFYENDDQSTNYDDSDMGDTSLEGTSQTGDSDEDESEGSSEMDDFVEHDTPTHIPHRAPRHQQFHPAAGVPATFYVSSDDEANEDDNTTNRESSQAPTSTTAPSVTTGASTGGVDSSSAESSEDESRRTPVPPSRPARQQRVILDDSDDEDQDQGQSQQNSDSDGSDVQSDATTIPAQPAANRRSRLQNQRARRGNDTNTATRSTLVSPPRRSAAPYSRGGFDNGRHQPYPLQASTSRRGVRQAYVAG